MATKPIQIGDAGVRERPIAVEISLNVDSCYWLLDLIPKHDGFYRELSHAITKWEQENE